MKLLVALCLVATVVTAAPPPQKSYPTDNVEITFYENENAGLGTYNHGYKQSDGQGAQQSGRIENEGREDEYLSVTGSFTWQSPDGVTYIVKYTAGKKGYHPEIEEGPGGVAPHIATLIG